MSERIFRMLNLILPTDVCWSTRSVWPEFHFGNRTSEKFLLQQNRNYQTETTRRKQPWKKRGIELYYCIEKEITSNERYYRSKSICESRNISECAVHANAQIPSFKCEKVCSSQWNGIEKYNKNSINVGYKDIYIYICECMLLVCLVLVCARALNICVREKERESAHWRGVWSCVSISSVLFVSECCRLPLFVQIAGCFVRSDHRSNLPATVRVFVCECVCVCLCMGMV